MRRNMSSRFLFSADDSQSSLPDIENPPDRPRTRTKRFLPFSVPRVPLSTLAMPCSVFLSLLFLLACCSLIYSLHKILFYALTVVVILLFAYFLFKTASRTDLLSFCTKKRSIFFYRHEPSAAKKSRINGLGVEFLDDGIYAGEFKEGIHNGRGVMETPGICTYGGDWVRGACDGYGVECVVGRGVYKGQFLKGKRTGYGCMEFINGDLYMGQWFCGERHGTGKHTCTDGSSYEGQFKQGKRHGLGAYRHRFFFSFIVLHLESSV